MTSTGIDPQSSDVQVLQLTALHNCDTDEYRNKRKPKKRQRASKCAKSTNFTSNSLECNELKVTTL